MQSEQGSVMGSFRIGVSPRITVNVHMDFQWRYPQSQPRATRVASRYNAVMERHERDFKGVWIPRDIWLSDQLSLMEKVLFVEINSLDNERGCFASNRYFATFFSVSDRQIRTYLSSLKEHGFVTVTVKNQNERVIRTAGRYRRVQPDDLRVLDRERSALTRKFTQISSRG